MLKRFAKALDVSTEQLLNDEDEHPEENEQHIERYERLNSKIYRTDECGEITITNCIKITTQVNNNRK